MFLDALACKSAAFADDRRNPRDRIDPETPSKLWCVATTSSALQTAFQNCRDYNSLDFDAIQYGAGHAPAVLLPPLVVLFDLGLVDARTVLLALVIGIETMAVLGETLAEGLRRRGLHPSSILGAIASAIACGWSLQFRERQLAAAASFAALKVRGTVAKLRTSDRSRQLADAARTGLEAAWAVLRGDLDQGADDVWLRQLRTLSGSLAEPPRAWSRPWALEDSHILIKRYPACGFIHPIVTALSTPALPLMTWSGTSRLGISIPTFFREPLLTGAHITTTDEARFSLEYALAIASSSGPPELKHYSDEYLRDSNIRQRLARISVTASPDAPGRPHRGPRRGRISTLAKSGAPLTLDFEIPSYVEPYDVFSTAADKFERESGPFLDGDATAHVRRVIAGFDERSSSEWHAVATLSFGR